MEVQSLCSSGLVNTMENLKEREMELQELFATIDVDTNGSLSLKEIVVFLKSVLDDICDENIKNIFNSLDNNEDKMVDFEEFKVNFSKSQSNKFKLIHKKCIQV